MTKEEFIEIFKVLDECERLMKEVNYAEGISLILNLKCQLIEKVHSNISE